MSRGGKWKMENGKWKMENGKLEISPLLMFRVNRSNQHVEDSCSDKHPPLCHPCECRPACLPGCIPHYNGQWAGRPAESVSI